MLFASPPLQSSGHPAHPDAKRYYRNFHGKRFTAENRDFKAVIIRTFEISDVILIEVLFNNPIDSESITSECVMVNNIPAELNQIRFSKNRKSFRYIFPKEKLSDGTDIFLFNLKNIKSINGNEMIAVELKDCDCSCEYRNSERDGLWKKF